MVNSLLQWESVNIMVSSSSRSVQLMYISNIIASSLTEISGDVTHVISNYNYPCSLVESFEIVAYTYAQQLSLNETQSFIALSFTFVAELVSAIAT